MNLIFISLAFCTGLQVLCIWAICKVIAFQKDIVKEQEMYVEGLEDLIDTLNVQITLFKNINNQNDDKLGGQ